ncbi:hypothetical protein E5676_scaffold477G001040 [Cucumis melo var. makuwa]|uniref:Uncharacterized protein n=1 Tax=Cucumis melo var. makuwa TaxID=1194695 RepID=A0A5D3CUF2_CUCMM|nr:hypothetical protein E5676_scaffold477G001040 [Cucumis melo var. makuwa]
MARHGHFWLLASLPLPLPRPLPEQHDMERVSIKYSVRDPLVQLGAKGPEQAGGSRTGGLARLEKQKSTRLEGSTGSSLHVNGARGDPANTAASTAGFSGAWRRLADGFRLARRGDFRSAKAAACRRGSSACKTRRLPIRKGDGLLGCAASKLLTRRDGAGRTREFGSGVTAGLPYKLAGIRRWCDGARVGGG